MIRTLLIAVALLAGSPAGAAQLSIEVTGLRSGQGHVHYGVYANPENFPQPEGRIAKGFTGAHQGGVTIVVKGLAPGTYAVAIFHDENGNGEFDQGWFGIPLEDYGFSNDASAFLGPPSFADAAVRVGPGDTRITISLD